MQHHMFTRMRMLAVLAGFGLALASSASAAQDAPASVALTPFDSKLRSAGFFDAAALPQDGEASPETLFRIAHSFRYRSEAQDRWQSAEETDARRSGDCEDKALWLYQKLTQGGHREVSLVVGRKAGARGLHVWVTLRGAGNTLLILDPSTQNRLWKESDFPKSSYVPLYSFDANGSHRHL